MNALDAGTRSLIEESAEWRLLSLLFECPAGEWRMQVEALAREVHDPELREAAGHALEEATEGLYHSIFGPGGPAPGREASYQDTVQLGYLMSELSAFYEAFAFQPKTSEAPDHIAVETAFIGYLRLKEAYARACSEQERSRVAADASREFIERHLREVAGRMAASLEHSDVRYLALAGEALHKRAGVPPKPSVASLLPVLEDDPSGCGEAQQGF